ncbi:MAG: penicillin-binding transpeptidase domain-containing protein [Mariprofundaceae bacterium]|nr:penicillin-binding transpeptidase domain-containing protein [Mariprofundaceae bacterium]
MIKRSNVHQDIYIRRRLEIVIALALLFFVLIIIRTIDLQWWQAEHLQQKVSKQQDFQFSTSVPRAPILDTNGQILSESVQVPSIAAIASEVPQNKWFALANALGISLEALTKKLTNKRGFVWLARKTTPKVANAVMQLKIKGIRQEHEWRRYQPLGAASGHVIGFVGMDGAGLEGLERTLNKQLQPEQGRMQIHHDARGNALPKSQWIKKPSLQKPVSLHIDSHIQTIAYAALVEGIRKFGAKAGSVVILRPQHGEIISMVNWPSYNPNDFSNHQPQQWRNRAITDVFEPGSVIKPFSIAAALTTGEWTMKSTVFCENGYFMVGRHAIHDDHPEQWLDLSGLISRSSNIGTAKVALDIGSIRLYETLVDVGLTKKSGLALGGESSGIIPPIERWGDVETANISFGQGIAITPLQLASAFSVLANGGFYITPRLVKDHKPINRLRVLDEQVTLDVMSMLEKATSRAGTGFRAVPKGYSVAGKTGTAQKASPQGGYAKGKYTAVFVGAVPAKKPELIIAVIIDEPVKNIYGGTVAAPVFRNIAQIALPYLGVLPDKKSKKTLAKSKWLKQTATKTTFENTIERGIMPTLFGQSLREVRHMLENSQHPLHANGSGWVIRQYPPALSPLTQNTPIEIWLDE